MARRRKKKKAGEPAKEDGPGFLGFRAVWSSPWLALLLALWAVAVLWAYYHHIKAPFLRPGFWMRYVPPLWAIPLDVLPRHLGHVCMGALFALCAVLLGRGALRALRVQGLGSLETFAFGLGLGTGVIGLSAFFLAAVGLLRPGAVYATAAALMAGALWTSRDLLRKEAWAPDPSLKGLFADGWSAPLAIMTAGVLLLEVFYALAPVISFDALVYHLGLPHQYRMEGGIVATPTNLYSGYPMLPQWAFAFLLFFSDDISVKLLQCACGAGIAAAFLGAGSRTGRPLAGWAACVIFLPTPLVVYNIVRPGVDVILSLLVLLSVYALSLYVAADEERKGPLLVLSAVLCGLALGCKYTIWPLLPILAGTLLWLKEPPKRVLRFALIASAFLAPWVVKSLWLYANPVFPYFHDTIAPSCEFPASWRVMQKHGWAREWPKILAGWRPLMETLLHPWFLTVRGSTEFDHVGPLFLIGLPALLWTRAASRESRLWLWSLFGLWMLWWPLTAMPRFFMPGLALLSVPLGLCLALTGNRWARGAAVVLLMGLSLDGFSMYSGITSESDSMSYLIRGMSREDYLGHSRRTYPACYYRAARWIGENTPEHARVLLLNGGRGYYMERRFVTSSDVDADLLTHWLKRSRGPAGLYGKLREAGITHIMANMAWVWRRDLDPGVTPEHLRVLKDFLKRHLRLIHIDHDRDEPRWVMVYEVVEEGEGDGSDDQPIYDWYRVGGNAGLKRAKEAQRAREKGAPSPGSTSGSPPDAGSRSPSGG